MCILLIKPAYLSMYFNAHWSIKRHQSINKGCKSIGIYFMQWWHWPLSDLGVRVRVRVNSMESDRTTHCTYIPTMKDIIDKGCIALVTLTQMTTYSGNIRGTPVVPTYWILKKSVNNQRLYKSKSVKFYLFSTQVIITQVIMVLCHCTLSLMLHGWYVNISQVVFW
jgi:hypothetical protein